MLAFNACPAQAFQSNFLVPAPRATYHATTFSSPAVPTTTMRYDNFSPWNLGCDGGNTEHFGSSGSSNSSRGFLQRRRNRFNPMIFEPSGGVGFQDSHQLQVGEPEVTDTGDTYKLTFEVSALVDCDGLDVSVSGRLLTVKVQRGFSKTDTDTDTDAGTHRSSGWVTRRNRTTGIDSTISRSFVLPEGVSASEGIASLTPEGNVEVVFTKDDASTTVAGEVTGIYY